MPDSTKKNVMVSSSSLVWWTGAVLVILSEAFVWWWRSPEKEAWSQTPLLELKEQPLEDSSAADSGYHFIPQPELLSGPAEQLSFSSAVCGSWVKQPQHDSSAGILDLFYFEYAAGNPRFIHDVFGHAPEICMRSVGASLKASHPERTIKVNNNRIDVQVLEFESPTTASPLWVFRITWLPPDAPFHPVNSSTTLRKEKLLAAFHRTPRPPSRVVLAGAREFSDLESAWTAFEESVVKSLHFVSASTNSQGPS